MATEPGCVQSSAIYTMDLGGQISVFFLMYIAPKVIWDFERSPIE